MIEKIISALEVEIESSDKYIREYDSSTVQKAYNKGMRQCLKIVQEVAKEYGNGWIPVETELPKEDERILCFHSHGFIDCGELVNGVWCCDMDEYAIKRDNVIAWMPLPPYQKGE